MQAWRRTRPRPVFVALLLAVLVFAIGYLRFLEREKTSPHAQATRLWAAHEEAVRQAIDVKRLGKGSYSLSDLENAYVFFRDLTGISIGLEIDFFGYHPNQDTTRGLALVQLWYARNSDRLVMNKAANRVEVLAPSDPAAAIWWRHEQMLIDLYRDRHLEAKQVEEARRFFFSLTGIEVPPAVDHPALGIVAAGGTQEALQALRNWYELNGNKLCWVNDDLVSVCKP